MADFYSDEIIEEIRIRTDIVELISEYVSLEKKGKYYFGLCPFHKEKTPSFSVTPDKQIFYCYGCGESGNAFHFLMKAENISFVEALKFLAERAKITLPQQGNTAVELKKKELRQLLLNINVEVAKHYYANLISVQGRRAIDYLNKRGLKSETIKKFGLGYSFNGWNDLYNYLKSKGFSDEIIHAGGYTIKKEKDGYFDRFRDRLMFPIFDNSGKVIAFGGRVLDDSLPKYMNSPETQLYNKGKNLYALNFAKKSCDKTLIVVEGYMDVITLYQNGITNVVASLGTALTESQGRLLKKYADDVIIAYDSDSAGQAATLRGLEVLSNLGCKVKVLTVPNGSDPDDFVRNNGKDAFLNLVEESLPLVEYKLKLIKTTADNDSIDGKVEFFNNIANVLSKIQNDVEREIYIKKISRETGVTTEALNAEIMKRMGKKSVGRQKTMVNGRNVENASVLTDKNNAVINAEKVLIWLLCNNKNNFDKVFNEISINDFTCEYSSKIAGIITNRIENNKDVTLNDILNSVESKEERNFLTDIINKEYEFNDDNEALYDAINKLKIARIEKRISEILTIIGSESNNERDVEILKQELKSLITSKNIIESKKLG